MFVRAFSESGALRRAAVAALVLAASVPLGALPPAEAQSEFSRVPYDRIVYGSGVDGPLVVRSGETHFTDDVQTWVLGKHDPGSLSLQVSQPELFSPGDVIFVFVGRGDWGGNFEFNRVLQVGASSLTLALPTRNTYRGFRGEEPHRVNVLRVPQHDRCVVEEGAVVSARPWDGNQGGVVVLLCSERITVRGEVDATGLGHRGGDSLATERNECADSGEGDRRPSSREVRDPHDNAGWGAGRDGDAFCGRQGGGGGGGNGSRGERGDGSGGGEGGEDHGTVTNGLTMGGGGGGARSRSTAVGGSVGGRGGGAILLRSRRIEVPGTVLANGLPAEGIVTETGSDRRLTAGAGAGGSLLLSAAEFDFGPGRIEALGAERIEIPPEEVPIFRMSGGAGGAGRTRLEFCDMRAGGVPPTANVQHVICPSPDTNLPSPQPCDDRTLLEPGLSMPQRPQIGRGEVHRYRFEVPKPFTQVAITFTRETASIEAAVTPLCADDLGALPLGTGSGRPIGTGSGRPIGPDEIMAFDVLHETGNWYVDIFGPQEEGAGSVEYELELGLRPSIEVHGGPATVVLADLPRLRALHPGDPRVDELAPLLDALATSSEGLVVDLATDPPSYVRQALATFHSADAPDLSTANLAATAITAWLRTKRETDWPRLHYVVLVGDDRVIPFHRRVVPVPSPLGGWRSEASYARDVGLDPGTGIGRALYADLALTDDPYGSPGPIPWGRYTVERPRMAVGRLVESPRQIAARVSRYLEHDGVIELSSSLVAGHSFVTDLAGALSERAGRAAPAGAHDYHRGNWRWEAVLGALATPRQFIALATHAAHDRMEAPRGLVLSPGEVGAAPADAAVILAVACHGGLSVPGSSAADRSLDFVETWSGWADAFVGVTGWAYGTSEGLGYQEQLADDLHRVMSIEDGVAIGDALVAAKRRYIDAFDADPMHLKTVLGTTLYGLPMARLRLDPEAPRVFPPSRVVRALPLPAVARAPDTGGARPAGLSSGGRVLRVSNVELADIAMEPQLVSGVGSYWRVAGSAPYVSVGGPLVPVVDYAVGEMAVGERRLAPRSAILRRASYMEVAPRGAVMPRVGCLSPVCDATTATAPQPPGGWWPPVPVELSPVVAPGLLARPVAVRDERRMRVFTGQYHGAIQAHRLFHSIVVDQLFSDDPDHDPPVIQDVRARWDAADLRLEVTVAEVEPSTAEIVAFCDQRDGSFSSAVLHHDLDASRGSVPGSGLWSGTVLGARACIVQAIDGAGNLAVAHNGGRYYAHEPHAGVRERTPLWMPWLGGGSR